MQRALRDLSRSVRRSAAWVIPTLVMLVPTAVAFAQTAPPQPSLKRSPPVWIGYLVMFVLAVLVVAVSLLPSKRGHQD